MFTILYFLLYCGFRSSVVCLLHWCPSMLAICYAPSLTPNSLAMRAPTVAMELRVDCKVGRSISNFICLDCFLLSHFVFANFPFLLGWFCEWSPSWFCCPDFLFRSTWWKSTSFISWFQLSIAICTALLSLKVSVAFRLRLTEIGVQRAASLCSRKERHVVRGLSVFDFDYPLKFFIFILYGSSVHIPYTFR